MRLKTIIKQQKTIPEYQFDTVDILKMTPTLEMARKRCHGIPEERR